MFKHFLTAVGTVTLLAACTATPEIQTGDDAEVILGGLHKVDNARTDMAYVDPSADFSKYDKILLMPLGVDNVEIIQPDTSGSMYRNRNKNWELTDSDKDKLQQVYREAMVKQLDTKGGYSIVTEPGDDVLQIQASLIAIAPSAPKDDGMSRGAGRSRVYTEGAGSLAVMVAFGDSETGDVLALMKDSRSSTSFWGANNSVTNMSDVRNMFSSWAIQIRKRLDEVHGK